MFDDDDLTDAFDALDSGICPQCGCEIDNGADGCTNPIHDMCQGAKNNFKIPALSFGSVGFFLYL